MQRSRYRYLYVCVHMQVRNVKGTSQLVDYSSTIISIENGGQTSISLLNALIKWLL
jgi:hypothetical protein